MDNTTCKYGSLILLILLTSLMWTAFTPSVVATTEIVAISGMTAPDGNGQFQSFSAPVLNGFGELAFRAVLSPFISDDDVGIYRGSPQPGTLTRIARSKVATQNDPGLSRPGSPALNDAGEVAFSAGYVLPLSAGGQSIQTLYRGSGGPLTTIASQHDPAPDGDGFFNEFDTPILNTAGDVAFRAHLVGNSGGSNYDAGVFRSSGGGITQIAREVPAGVFQFGLADLSWPRISADGSLAFLATLVQSPTVGSKSFPGVYRGSGGPLNAIASAGEPAPDGNGVFQGFDEPAFSDSSQMAFRAVLAETQANQGIYISGMGGTVTQLARRGDTVSSGGGQFQAFAAPAVNNNGMAAFWAQLENTDPSYDQGIFLASSVGVTPIAREGTLLPDGSGLFIGFEPTVSVNDDDQVAFIGYVSGQFGQSIFLGNGIDTIRVADVGQTLAGGTIVDLIWTDETGPTGGGRGAFNNEGQVAYRAILDSGPEAIIRYSIPLPKWTSPLANGFWAVSQNWSGGIVPNSFHHATIQPGSSVVVIGPDEDEYVRSLTLGALAGEAVLRVDHGGNLTALEDISINARGRIVLGTRHVLAAQTLANRGILTGDGMVVAQLINHSTGQVRVDPSQRLQVIGGGPHMNYGLVEATGAAVEFTGPVINPPSANIRANQDATLRFNDGLINQGTMAVGGGTNRVFGSVDNLGQMVVAQNTNAVFQGDVVNRGVLHVGRDAMAIFLSELSGGGSNGPGIVHLRDAVRPGLPVGEMAFGGDVYFGPFSRLEVELGGTDADQFDTVRIAGTAMISEQVYLNVIPWRDFLPSPGDRFTVMRWRQGLQGMFDGLMVDSYFIDQGIGFVPEYVHRDGDGWLILNVVPEPATSAILVVVLGWSAAMRTATCCHRRVAVTLRRDGGSGQLAKTSFW